MQDHLAGVQRQGETDLALLTDGLATSSPPIPRKAPGGMCQAMQ